MIRSLYVYLVLGTAVVGLGASLVGLGLYAWGLSGRLDLAETERDTALATASALKTDLENERAEVVRVNSLLESLENKEAEVRYVETVVNKEVVKYRDRVVNRCQLSRDWVCIANASAKGVPADCGAVEVQN